MAANSHGHFVWYELMTTDVGAAKAFYAGVMGWGARDVPMAGRAFALFTASRTPVAGLMRLPENAGTMGVAPRWTGYVGVDDLDTATALITRRGGAVYVPPTEIPNTSRFTLFTDPQMATLGVLQSIGPDGPPPAEISALGRVGWHELIATDCEKALAFYGELFGWQKSDADAGATNAYQRFSVGGRTIGGMLTTPPTGPAPFWLYYFNIDDIDAATKRVTAGGGEVLDGPIESPGGAWIAQCTDPQGAMFALAGARRRKAVGYFERAAPRDPSDTRSRRWSW